MLYQQWRDADAQTFSIPTLDNTLTQLDCAYTMCDSHADSRTGAVIKLISKNMLWEKIFFAFIQVLLLENG